MFRKKIFATAGYNTTYYGPGRKEFNPKKPMPTFETYLQDTAKGTLDQVPSPQFDEGVIGSFMAARFIKQANLPGFLPYMVPSLLKKPCTAVEGACGTGGRAIATAARSVLSDQANTVFVAGFEIQNIVKSVYGADVLAGADYYNKKRKTGHGFFFPGIFSDRAGAYYKKWGNKRAREGMAKWYEQSILNARKYPHAQEYHNTTEDLYSLGMTPPNPDKFLPHLNHFDCSKITDGASSLVITSEEGLKQLNIDPSQAIEIIAIAGVEGDITKDPDDSTILDTTQTAVKKALEQTNLSMDDIGLLEIHDCFSITALLSLEATGLVGPGESSDFITQEETRPGGKMPTNLSGGLCGFGHPTGATGIRQLVDLIHQFTGKAKNPGNPTKPYGMLISMGGNDKTVTCIIVKG